MQLLKKRTTSAIVVLALLALALTIGGPARAVHGEAFELDGNIAVDPGGDQSVDWASIFTSAGGLRASLPTNFTTGGFNADGALPDKTTFTTGSKDTLDITPGWQCAKSNNVGDKVDILNAYATAYLDTSQSPPHLVLYFGVEKSSPNGDSNLGVWFLKDPNVDCSSSGATKAFTGKHSEGDVLVVTEFTNGGTNASVKAYKWQNGALNPNPFISGGKCSAASADDRACATVNTSAVTPPWPSVDKTGGALDALEFFEGGVDLGTLSEAGCFASYLANTRSSQSLTATIFDYSKGSLPVCNPSTKLTVSTSPSPARVHGGDPVTVTFHELNNGDVPLTNVSVTTTTAGCLTPAKSGEATGGNGDSTLDVGETWNFACTLRPTASLTITGVGHGFDPIGREVTDCGTSPANGRVCDPEEKASVGITVYNPGTQLTKTASAAVTYTYTETNKGDTALTNVSVEDDKCSPVTYVSGDTNGDSKLDTTESWKFTCTATYNSANGNVNVTNTAIGHGFDPLGFDVTYCTSPVGNQVCDARERDQVTLSITNH